MTKQQRKILIKIIIGAVLFAVAMAVTHLLTLPWWAELLIFLAVYLVPGFSVLEKAVRNIAHGQVFDENFLMTIASIAAFAIGQYPEAVEVILFYQVGELFEKIAVGRSRQAVSDLLDLCPDEATVLRDGKPETVLVDEVEVGEHILVRPGEKIPLDAEVFEGHTTIDTAALTGESMPVTAGVGDAVCSGCVNLSGAVELVVTKPASESTASKIMELVEESASSKAKTEQFITKFARFYTPLRGHCRCNSGSAAAAHYRAGVLRLDLSCADVPHYLLPMCTGHLCAAELFRRYRLCVQKRRPGKGQQLSGGRSLMRRR